MFVLLVYMQDVLLCVDIAVGFVDSRLSCHEVNVNVCAIPIFVGGQLDDEPSASPYHTVNACIVNTILWR